MFKKYSLLVLACAVQSSNAAITTLKISDKATLTASIDNDKITFDAIVTKNGWLGLGFGRNDTAKMEQADVIQFIAGADVSKSSVGDVYVDT